jgi:translation initiation factor 2 gamma subunit (eIF-2gamma)
MILGCTRDGVRLYLAHDSASAMASIDHANETQHNILQLIGGYYTVESPIASMSAKGAFAVHDVPVNCLASALHPAWGLYRNGLMQVVPFSYRANTPSNSNTNCTGGVRSATIVLLQRLGVTAQYGKV